MRKLLLSFRLRYFIRCACEIASADAAAPATGPLLALLLCFPNPGSGLKAQHFLPNGDFKNLNICCEYHVSCAPMGWWTSSSSTFNFKPIRYDKAKLPIPMPAMIKMRGKDGLNERSYIQAPLLCPLKEGETYKIQIGYSQGNLHFSEIGVYFSDSFIHVPSTRHYQIDTISGLFRLHQFDSLLSFEPQQAIPLQARVLSVGVKTATILYRATGKEKFILLGNFEEDTFTPFRKGLFARKEEASYLSIHQISLVPGSGMTCDCEKQEEILETLNRRHSFFGACRDTLPINMNALFADIGEWKSHQEYPSEPGAIPVLEAGRAYRIDRLYFAFDSAVLERRSFPSLDSLASILLQYPGYSVDIIGHTDSLGNVAYNELLSLDRAEAVKAYLVSQGIDPEKLKALGRGSSEPVATNQTEEGRQLNRRVEFILRKE